MTGASSSGSSEIASIRAPHIFASFRIVGGSGEQRCRPVALSIQIALVKRIDAYPELLRLASDLIERRQPVVNIKHGVLQSLGHDRASGLLKFQHEMGVGFAGGVVEIFREI